MKYLDYLSQQANRDAICRIHQQRTDWVNQAKKGFLRYREPFMALADYRAGHLDFASDIVTIGSADEVSHGQRETIRNELKRFMPWRKGPFSVFGIDIDAEWRSERKWQRLLPELPNLHDKVVADIGCNNGYYMFRMVPHRPKLVLGFEPTVQHYYCFKALNGMAGCDNLEIDLLGVEHIQYFQESFDIIFLMGIIYHRPSPIDCLRDIVTALKPGGTLILETQAIPGDQPVALFPDKTYAKVPGTYFVPTTSCLINWMRKSGLQEVKSFSRHPMSTDEQRRTEWMVFESYEDFIDPANPHLTIEGYPAPLRILTKAKKRG